MLETMTVENVKCGGCANTLKKALKPEFGDVRVNLEVEPREITLDLEPGRREELKMKLRELGYPMSTDELGVLQEVGTTAKSFVSCSLGKVDNLFHDNSA
jgi:copper chaperone CopZ